MEAAPGQPIGTRRRAAPQGVVNRAGDGTALGADAPDAAARLVAQPARDEHAAQLAAADELDRLTDAAVAADLRTGLANPVVPLGELDDSPALADVVAHRLLDVHILAGLDRPDGRQRV